MPALTREELDHFEHEGYVVVKDIIDPAQSLDPVIGEYATVLDRLADQLYTNGDIASRYDELEFGARYIQICTDTQKVYSAYFDFSLPFQNVKADSPFWAGPAVFGALTDADLLDAVEALIGPEIYSNPVQHVRIKPPEHLLPKNQYGNPILGATQWHQDHGVITPEADDTRMLTVWFSLQDTPFEKGPLMVVPGSHKNGLLAHCPNYMDNAPQFAGAAQIPEKLFAADQAIPLPIKRGDVIFMHKQTIHGSYPNISDEVRWSFDLRYNPTDQPTGRIAFPGFVARSRANPQSELRDPAEWHRRWLETRATMATINQGDQIDVPFHRPQIAHPLCA
jgi:phytanoyl-CoA hydroxylase